MSLGTRQRWLAAVAGLAVLVAAGYAGYRQLLKMAVIRYNEYDRRERGSLRPGDPAPDLGLAAYGGGAVRLSELWRERPVFLVFGSCT